MILIQSISSTARIHRLDCHLGISVAVFLRLGPLPAVALWSTVLDLYFFLRILLPHCGVDF